DHGRAVQQRQTVAGGEAGQQSGEGGGGGFGRLFLDAQRGRLGGFAGSFRAGGRSGVRGVDLDRVGGRRMLRPGRNAGGRQQKQGEKTGRAPRGAEGGGGLAWRQVVGRHAGSGKMRSGNSAVISRRFGSQIVIYSLMIP